MAGDGVEIDTGLVRRLVDRQFPRWRSLPLRRVEPAGFDHVIHRLGDELAVRLPRHPRAAGQAELEQRWLPWLAPRLPLAIPVPVAVGRPACGYPWSWAVSRWMNGSVATAADDSPGNALVLAGFLTALQQCPVGAGAPAGGSTPAQLDEATRATIARVAGVFDAAALTAVWDEALAAPAWGRDPVWFHGDFHAGNLLTAGGRVCAVIDFGGLGAGDPARDMTMAFTLMGDATRETFRAALAVDDATCARGRGFALASGLNAYCSSAEARVREDATRQILAAASSAR